MLVDAFIVRTIPLREHDQRVVLYTRQMGKCSAIARGSLRPSSVQALALDEGNIIRCDLIPGRSEMPIMVGAQAQRCWATAKQSPAQWSVALALMQMISSMIYDGQPDERLWELIVRTCTALEQDHPALVVFRAMQQDVLEILGYGRCAAGDPIPEPIAIDATCEHIAQRHLTAFDMVYRLARVPSPVVE